MHKSIGRDDAAVQGYAQPDISGTGELEHVVVLLSIRIFIAAFYFWRDFRSREDSGISYGKLAYIIKE